MKKFVVCLLCFECTIMSLNLNSLEVKQVKDEEVHGKSQAKFKGAKVLKNKSFPSLGYQCYS